MNSDKCHFILSSNDENKNIELNRDVTNNTLVQKLLGVHIHYKLKFYTQIEILSKKVGKSFMPLPYYKLHVYKPNATINEKFYIVTIQLLSTHLDIS